jgi:hypothetical protein
MDPATQKTLFFAIFNAGMIWGGIKAGQRQQRERQLRQGRQITRLTQYKAWSHRALSVLIAFHRQNHPHQDIIDDWKEVDEGSNGGSNGDN